MSDTKVKENENKQEQDKKDQNVEQLEMLAFHFTQICQRLSGDREHWAETGKDLAGAVNNLNETLHKFTQLEKKVAEQIATVIIQGSHNAVQTIVDAVGEKTQHVLTKQIKEVAGYLSTVVREATSTLTDYKWQVEGIKKWFLIGVSISSLLGNILAGIAVYHFLGNMYDRNALEIVKEIKAIRGEEKSPSPSNHKTRTRK